MSLSSEGEWGDWIAHDGSGYIDRLTGLYVQIEVERARGSFAIQEGYAQPPVCCDSWDWSKWGFFCLTTGKWTSRVTRYRIRQSRAFRELRELLNIPELTLAEADP